MNQFISDLWIQLQEYYDGFVAVFPKLIMATFAFSILFFLANRSSGLVRSNLTRRMDDPLLAQFLARVVKISLILFAVMVVLNIIGLGGIAAGFFTGASVSAIIIGFAFKDIGENFLAGIILAFNRPFRVGDIVELNNMKGKVVSLNMRNTQIKSFDGKDIYIPNANVIKNPVVNYTIDGFIRDEFTIGLDYGSDFDKAIDILRNTIVRIEGVLTESRAPSVFIKDLNTSTLDITVQYWRDTFDSQFSALDIRTNSIKQCLTALDKAGFYLPGEVVELKNYNNLELKASQMTKN
ncbi:MAG: mechanosensitive ion channel family protein [Chitinophagales bacterium]